MRDQITTTKANGKWASLADVDVSAIQNQVIDTAKDAYERILAGASKALAEANNQTSTLVRKYPVECTAGALACGFLVGALAFRRRV